MSFDLGCFSFPESPSEAGTAPTLSWRMDPAKSLSDWTLNIIPKTSHDASVKDVHEVQTYHVHRTSLATGPRFSLYFEHEFQTKESDAKTTTIEFEPSTAEAIPVMLDFIYSPIGKVNATTDNAVALRHLANYFGIHALFDAVNDFVHVDLSPTTSPVYLSESAVYYDEKIMDAAFKLCVTNFGKLDEDSLADLPPKLFRKVVLAPDLICDSKALSVRVATFWKKHSLKLDTGLLRELTDNTLMPEIHPESAVYFLKLALEHNLTNNVEVKSTHVVDVTTTEDVEVNTVNTSLKSRCEAAAAKNWDISLTKALTNDATDEAKRTYEQLPDSIRIKILENAIMSASKERSQLHQDLGRFIRVPVEHKFDAYGFISHYVEGDKALSRPPSAMPMLTDQTLDGYLFHAGSDVWPVFYYSGVGESKKESQNEVASTK